MFGWLKKNDNTPMYQIVEKHDVETDTYVQGVRIMSGEYSGVVFVTSGKVSLKPKGEEFELNYQYDVCVLPKDMVIDHDKFSPIVGNIIMDIIQKEHNAS